MSESTIEKRIRNILIGAAVLSVILSILSAVLHPIGYHGTTYIVESTVVEYGVSEPPRVSLWWVAAGAVYTFAAAAMAVFSVGVLIAILSIVEEFGESVVCWLMEVAD